MIAAVPVGRESDERLDRLAAAAVAEADWFFGGPIPDQRSELYDVLARHVARRRPILEILAGARHPTVKLLFAAVHHVLLRGASHELSQWYGSLGGTRAPDDGGLPAAFDAFVAEHRDTLVELTATRNVQTNEVRRTAGLLPVLAVIAERAGAPLALVELGTSAGLNLLVDRYAYDYGEHGFVGDRDAGLVLTCELRGPVPAPLPRAVPDVASRVGVDIDPVDVTDDAAVDWLRACVWPHHQERRERLDRAVAIARRDPPPIVRGDMVDTLRDALRSVPGGTVPVVFHTSAVNYLKRPRREALVEEIRAAAADLDGRLVWVYGEGPDTATGIDHPRAVETLGVILAVTTFAGGKRDTRVLALAGAHGGWIEWVDGAA